MTRKRKSSNSTIKTEDDEEYSFSDADSLFNEESSSKRKRTKNAKTIPNGGAIDTVGRKQVAGKGKGNQMSIIETSTNAEWSDEASVERDKRPSSNATSEEPQERIIKRRKKKQKFNCKVCDAKVYKAQKKLFTACAICGDMAHSKCIKDRSKEWICRTCVADPYSASQPHHNSPHQPHFSSSRTYTQGRKKSDTTDNAASKQISKPVEFRRPTRGTKSSPGQILDYSQYTCPTCGLLVCSCKGGILFDDGDDDEDEIFDEAALSDDYEYEVEQDLSRNEEEEKEDQIDIFLPPSHSSRRLFIADSDGSETEDVMSIDSQYDSSLESEESSIYEEPESTSIGEESEEGLMADMVREKLLNGWDEDSDEYFEEAEDFFDAPQLLEEDSIVATVDDIDDDEEEAILEEETSAIIQADVEKQRIVNSLIMGEFESGVSLDKNHSILKKSGGGCGKKKVTINTTPIFHSETAPFSAIPSPSSVTSTPSTHQSSNTKLLSHLLTFASLKKANTPKNPSALSTILPNSAEANTTASPAAAEFSSPLNSAAITSKLLKRPVSLSNVATTAAAIVSSPAVLKAFKQLSSKKVKETLALHAKLKAAALKAVASGNAISSLSGLNNQRTATASDVAIGVSGGTSAVDHLQAVFDSRVSDTPIKDDAREEEIDESTLFEDIFDHGRFAAEGSRSPSPPLSPNRKSGTDGLNQTDFSRFTKIPIGTFWKSQRKGSKGGIGISKRKDLQRAIKKSSDFKILDSTLMENIPKPSKKLSKSTLRSSSSNSFLFSPVLFAEDVSKLQFSASANAVDNFPPSTPLDFLSSSALPPPFILP